MLIRELSMPTKAKAAAITAREDILSPHAMSTISAGAVSAMSAVGAAVIKMNKGAAAQKAGLVLAPVREVRSQGRPHRGAGRARSQRLRRCDLH